MGQRSSAAWRRVLQVGRAGPQARVGRATLATCARRRFRPACRRPCGTPTAALTLQAFDQSMRRQVRGSAQHARCAQSRPASTASPTAFAPYQAALPHWANRKTPPQKSCLDSVQWARSLILSPVSTSNVSLLNDLERRTCSVVE